MEALSEGYIDIPEEVLEPVKTLRPSSKKRSSRRLWIYKQHRVGAHVKT
jgi:hypothetical protein